MQEDASSAGSSSEHPREEKEMKKHRKKNNTAVRMTAVAMAVTLAAGPASTVAYALPEDTSNTAATLDAQQSQTKTQQLYTVGNTSYENGAGTTKGNGHDCQHLGIWVPKGTTFKIRQTNTALGQDLTLKMRNDDSQTEQRYTLNKDGSWLEITAIADSVPLISSVYSANGEKPEVEFTVEGTEKLPVYEFGGDEAAFYKEWDELNAPFAVFLSEYTIWLVPARDKTNNQVGSLDDLLLWYDNMIRQYNSFVGLSKNATEVWNQDSGTRYFIKVNRHGAGAAYYSVVETAPNGDSLIGYMNTGNWGPLHEVGHGYDTVNFNSAEIWNNVMAHYYQVSAFGAGRWLNSSEAARAGHEKERAENGYFKTNNYGSKLYFWVNMLDKLGPQKTSAYAYQLYRSNKANGIANLGGHDFYVDAYTRGSGYNVSAWFDMWGFTVSDSVKQALIEAETYQNVYPLRNLVSDDATAETIRQAMLLTSKYSLVETQELLNYFKSADAITGTLTVHLDDTSFAVTEGQKLRITDGVNTVKEVEITAQDMTIDLPIGYYNIIVPTAKDGQNIVLNNRVGYAVVGEGQNADYTVTAEKVTAASEFADWTFRFGSTYTYNGIFCTATTDMANQTLHITSVQCQPHTYIDNFASLKVCDADGVEVYNKQMSGKGTPKEDTTIHIEPGYTIETFHQEPGRGYYVQSSAVNSVSLVYNDSKNNNPNQKTFKFEVTEYGLKMLSPVEKFDEDNYYSVLTAYMDNLKSSNPQADFQNAEKFPAEKAKVNAAVAKLPEKYKKAFETAYEGYYPFDQGIREMKIADIPAQDYTGSAVTPHLDISVGKTKLSEDDYHAEWLHNTDVGTARVRVYGLGEYSDCSGETTFEIKLPDSLPKSFDVTSEYSEVAFSNGAKRPDATVKIGDKVLTRNVDYILAYSNNTNIGTATVTANGIGNYKGISGSTTFEITPKSVKLAVTTSPTNISYTGEPVTTGITVMSGKMKLTENKDYTVSYVNNTDVGTATVIATGIGNYEGSSGTGTFEITEPDTPKDIGATQFSDWTYQLCSWYSGLFSIMRFDLEDGKLTVEHRNCHPHDNFSTAYASIEVYDTKGSRCYNKEYIGNKSNYAPTDTVELGLGYKVKIYVAEPGRGSTAVYSNTAPTVSMRPSQSAEYVVTARGLQQITSDGSVGAGDLTSQYATVMHAYMDKLKEEHPEQADFWDSTKFTVEKAAVEKGVKLLTADELAQFEADYEGYYPFSAPTDAQAPADIALISANYEIGQQAAALDGTTQAADGGTITYQWYRASTADDFEGTVIDGATEPTYTPDTNTAGTYYYFVKATNTNGDATGNKTASVTSSMATITVMVPVVKEIYSVVYDWGNDYPSDVELPKDDESYDNLTDAEAALSKQTYTNASTSAADKDGKQGKWTFSGWTVSVEGTIVKFTGRWIFFETQKVDAATPAAISLMNASYKQGDTAAALNGETTASDEGTISYQWYEGTNADDFNGVAIDGAVNATYQPPTDKAGTYYYYVVATNTNTAATGSQTTSVTSTMAVIAVMEPEVSVSYSVLYDWGSEFPDDAVLPVDEAQYDNIADAEAALDKQTYTSESTSSADKNGASGHWSFSGWTSSVDGTTVKFTGHWTFTADAAPVDAVAPDAIKLSSAQYNVGDTAVFLNGTTTVSDGGTISYQWYRASSETDFTGTAIENATNVTYTPSTDEGGTYYYFVVATNTNDTVDGSKTARTTSNMAVITVTKPASNNSGSSSGGGSSSSVPSYAVSVQKTANGAVTVPNTAAKGSTVTITVKPDTGYEVSNLSAADQNGNRLTLTDKGERKYSFSMPDGKVIITVSFRQIQEKHNISFADVPSTAYYAEAVQWAVEKGITEGTDANTFSPNLSCTRAQMVTFLWRAAGCPKPNNTGDGQFADIDRNAYYYEAVLWAVEQGITNGTGNGAFRPNATVTRGQTAAFLYRAAGSPSVNTKPGFTDIHVNDYYADAVAWAEKNGITSGVGEARYNPSGRCTRAQIVSFLYRSQK